MALVQLLSLMSLFFASTQGFIFLGSTGIWSLLQSHKSFSDWGQLYNKTYSDSTIQQTRFFNFIENEATIFIKNEKFVGKTHFDLNKYADLTDKEFEETYLMPDLEFDLDLGTRAKRQYDTNIIPPDSHDWKNLTTPVQDQGDAGTCYIFAALDQLGSRWAIKGHEVVPLSVQQVADGLAIVKEPKSAGIIACGMKGGRAQAVYDYIQRIGGIISSSDYPYCVGTRACQPCQPEGYNSQLCGKYPLNFCRPEESYNAKFDMSKFVPGLKVSTWSKISQNEIEIQTALYQLGPLFVGVNAKELKFYKSGILSDESDSCDPRLLNHAMLLVGYGTENDRKYWLVKNSWGQTWGEDGYIRMARERGTCGINREVSDVQLV